ncbi:MAG: formate dehydrogenase accessory sulfurtransferase FdhD, partial [Gammaproteobacteria bacterium]
RGQRRVPEEVPVALRVNCIDYAVMLASPADLEDFAYGFMRTEGLIDSPEDVRALSLLDQDEGIVVRVQLRSTAALKGLTKGRRLAGATGCGLCGVQALRDAVRPVERIDSGLKVTPQAVRRAVSMLREWQPLNASTGALHAAAFATADGEITVAREDVGRHNALDKLIGSLLRDGRAPQDGFAVMSSRCSYELVQKAAGFGIGMLCTVSAPTALAIRLAADANMTLVSIARPDSFVVLVGEERFDW